MHRSAILFGWLAIAGNLLTGCSAPSQSNDPSTQPTVAEGQTLDSGMNSSNNVGKAPTYHQPIMQQLEVDKDPPVNISDVIRCLLEDANGNLWLGTQSGLFCRRSDQLTCYDVKGSLGQSVTVINVAEGKDGVIWCATNGGVLRIKGNLYQSFGIKSGLTSCEVWSIALDAEGNVWAGTMEGVFKFDGRLFQPFDIPESIPDPTRGVTSAKIVHCIFPDTKGNIWFGTNGGAYVFDGDRLSNLSVNDGLPNNVVHSICEDQSGNIWLGTTHQGICRYDGKRFDNFTKQGQIDGKEIWCQHKDRLGNIWFSGKRFGVYCYDGHSFINYGEADGLESPGLMSILHDKHGVLWLAGVNGLFKRKNDGFTQVKLTGPW